MEKMDKEIKEYWNDTYWKKQLENHEGKNQDFLYDLWADKYQYIIEKINRGTALDLGCGLGQCTKYFMGKGFSVISADISSEVLQRLKSEIKNAQIIQLDMSKLFLFEDDSFDLVFANLSIHYFDKETTISLLKEINRILKPNGYFIGSVNSSKSFVLIKDDATELEPNYYYESGRNVRLWDQVQFDSFFKDFDLEVLEEVTTTRWNRTKIMWEFVGKSKKEALSRKS